MKLYTRVGTRVRLKDDLDSPVIKTYLEILEMDVLEKRPSESGMWYKVKQAEIEGWVMSKSVNFKK